MPNINKYAEVTLEDNDARTAFADKHSPFIYVDGAAKAGQPIEIKVVVGKNVAHPDDFKHYVSDVALYDGEKKVAEAKFFAGNIAGEGKAGKQTVTFTVTLEKDATLVAHAYCTLHGVWESEPFDLKLT